METLLEDSPFCVQLQLMLACLRGLHLFFFLYFLFVDQHESTDVHIPNPASYLILKYAIKRSVRWRITEVFHQLKPNLAVVDVGIFNVDQTKNVCALPFKAVVSTASATVC